MEFLASGKLKDRKLAKGVFKALDTNGDGELVIPEYLRVWGKWARHWRLDVYLSDSGITMKSIQKLFFILILSSFTSGCVGVFSWDKAKNVKTVKLDPIDDFMGCWYVISAIPNSICWPCGEYFHFWAEVTFFSLKISVFVFLLKIFLWFTQLPKLVETVTSGEVVIILLEALSLSFPISFNICPKASCVLI